MNTRPDHGLSGDEAERLATLRQLLDAAGADYALLSHAQTVASAGEGVEQGMGELAQMAPTLILKTERGLVAAIISGDTRLSYKKIKRALGLRDVSLATPDVVLQATGAHVGSVSLVNPGMPTIVDSGLTEKAVVYGGCGVPRHTLCINPADLIRATGAEVFDLTEARQAEG